MEFENLITLINSVSASRLTEFSMESEGVHIAIKAERDLQTTAGAQPAAVPVQVQVSGPVETSETVEGEVVKSPLVGTFYSCESPEASPFVSVGDTVKKGQTLGIVEAMKLMNEITSEYDGVVKDICVKNEQAVEYGQPLFVIA